MVTVDLIDEDAGVPSAEVINVDMSTAEALSLGDAYYVDENYTSAIDAYTAALLVKRDSELTLHFRILNHRSGAFYHLGRYQEAHDDAVEASKILSASPIAGLRTGETELCSRREGLAAFKLENYKSAKMALEKAAQLAALNKRDVIAYEDWIRQCDEQLAPPVKAAKAPPVSTVLPKAPPPAAPALATPKAPTPAGATTKVSGVPAPLAPTNRKPSPPKYQYYQSDKFMTVAILEANVKQEDIETDFQTKHLTVKLRKGGMVFTVVAGELYEEVDPSNCRVNIRDEKVLIKLRKTKAHEWHELMSKVRKTTPPAPAVPVDEDKSVPIVDDSKPRPYASKRDWDAIERLAKAEEENEKPEGDAAMNSLFQKLYRDADEDTQRAMIKSYQTSGGTVLSTNWNEVKDKDYEKERIAPKGQEWKTWEGDKLEMKEDD